jgi:hypothetical protein
MGEIDIESGDTGGTGGVSGNIEIFVDRPDEELFKIKTNTLEDKMELFEKALKFYANKIYYNAKNSKCLPLPGWYCDTSKIKTIIEEDNGKIARIVLGLE